MLLPQESTLLDLVQSVMNETDNDDEVVATVVHLINSGQVRLRGTFANAKIILPDDIAISKRIFERLFRFHFRNTPLSVPPITPVAQA